MALKIYPFIMCGGAGTRLWPMSTRERPKQFQKIVSDLSMLQETASRGGRSQDVEVAPASFVCSSMHKDLVLEQCRDIGIDPYKVILEPLARNTAAVAATIGLVMEACEEEALVLLLPADHHIEDVPAFWSYIESGCGAAVDGDIVTFGIQPTHPETGYGYIKAGQQKPSKALKIVEFVEKPDLATAKAYLDDGTYYWNAGIFLFRPDVILESFEAHAEDILDSVKLAVGEATSRKKLLFLDANKFDQCRSESFDYAIMEKATNISLIGPLKVGWNDIGSWRAVWEHEVDMQQGGGSKEESGTCLIDSREVLIRSSGQFVATVGVSRLGVIATPESILVIDLDSAQDVKKVVNSLKAQGLEHLL